jgi:hypothetical protein
MALVRLAQTSDAKKLRRRAWAGQCTFRTPLNDLPRFVGALLAGQEQLVGCRVFIEEVVFEPQALNTLLREHGLDPIRDGEGLEANAAQTAAEVLEHCLACWIDFFWVPIPAGIVLYADHDEYTTLLGAGSSGLSATRALLLSSGFQEVEDYTRHW